MIPVSMKLYCQSPSPDLMYVYFNDHHTFFKWRVEGCGENFNRLIQLWQNVWLAYFQCNMWVFRFIIQVQVFVFRYSGSGIQVQYSGSVFRFSIQAWALMFVFVYSHSVFMFR